MCDTLVAMGNSTGDGSVIFAKNSDRQPNEPLIMMRIPRKYHKQGEKLKCTYIEVEQSELTYEVFLLKPSWIWGCEMGSNEFGLNIGNEAVFTREKYGKTGLLGMDMVRLALERCKTSEEALEFIVYLLEEYGQGGNCGYKKKFTYHNSFLIADRESAWVLETAGEFWAAEKVRDVRSISNCLSIHKSFDRAHPRLIEHAIKKGWCRSEKEFDFARCYSDPLFTYFSGARIRQHYCQSNLEGNRGNIGLNLIKSILRSHLPDIAGQQFKRPSLKSVCMHGGGLFGDHTTGSYIAKLTPQHCTCWVTGSSTPCLAVFKPMWLLDYEKIPFPETDFESALVFWEKRELLHRMAINNQISKLDDYILERDQMEQEWLKITAEFEAGEGNAHEMKRFMDLVWSKEEELVNKVLKENDSNQPRPGGSLFFRYFWNRQTAELMKNKERG